MKQTYDNERLHLVTADICNPRTYHSFLECADVIIHTAALKHVESANLKEYMRVNIQGTEELLELTHLPFVLISTDKVCHPESDYGYTKALAESLTLQKGESVIRLGNFTISNGNLLELFDLKDPQCYCAGMTRFFEETDVIAEYVLKRTRLLCETFKQNRGGVYVPKMKTAVIRDIFAAYNKPINDLGWFRPGEKMHEFLITEHDRSVYDLGDYYYIGEKHLSTKRMPKGFTYKSNENSNRWTIEEIQKWKKQ